MTTLKHLVRGATRSGKSPGWAISDPQPTEMDSLGRLGAPIIADVHAQRADPKRSLLKESRELGGVWTASPPDAVAFEKLLWFGLFLYAAQAAIGFGVGLVLPWLVYFGVIQREW
jgi:hypothetical protein